LLRLALNYDPSSLHLWPKLCLYLLPYFVYVCMYVCMYVCVYVCMYVLFIVELGFEFRVTLTLARQALYHLSCASSPQTAS
jgi:hypothetical protein